MYASRRLPFKAHANSVHVHDLCNVPTASLYLFGFRHGIISKQIKVKGKGILSIIHKLYGWAISSNHCC